MFFFMEFDIVTDAVSTQWTILRWYSKEPPNGNIYHQLSNQGNLYIFFRLKCMSHWLMQIAHNTGNNFLASSSLIGWLYTTFRSNSKQCFSYSTEKSWLQGTRLIQNLPKFARHKIWMISTLLFENLIRKSNT